MACTVETWLELLASDTDRDQGVMVQASASDRVPALEMESELESGPDSVVAPLALVMASVWVWAWGCMVLGVLVWATQQLWLTRQVWVRVLVWVLVWVSACAWAW